MINFTLQIIYWNPNTGGKESKKLEKYELTLEEFNQDLLEGTLKLKCKQYFIVTFKCVYF